MAGSESRPWPVLLLTAIGAWLAALPLLAVLGMLLGDVLSKGVGPYLAGVLLLAAAIVVLRGRDVPIFFEQLAVPALLVGLGALGMGLKRDLPEQAGSAVLCALVLGVAWAIPRAWLRMLLGAGAAALAVGALMPRGLFGGAVLAPWLGLHVALAIWLAAMWSEREPEFFEPVGAGWVLLLLGGLAAWSGMTFLVAGLAPGVRGDAMRGFDSNSLSWRAAQAFSVVLCVAAAALAARRWPALRQPLAVVAAAVVAALGWFMPALGGVVLALAWTCARGQWRLAAAAALAAVWTLGSFYYRLQWPLATKALVLAGAGAVLGFVAWWAQRSSQPPRETATRRSWTAPGFIALSAAATLALANYSIAEKEDLIARGQKVFVELAPVDPRSLMQGDYMRLNYRLPDNVESHGALLAATARPFVVMKRDERGVAQPLRLVRQMEALQPGELLIELTPKEGRWILVSDAWYFREGDDRRWQAAKYGEFRVMPDGRALLVGLADGQLRGIARD
ncbi:MAG: GDYXXLXY domain-containing protein [Burkholderiales bacterium]|nr:GDYXXLXY domain-containing protein [Burkholderiales bacterium]